MLHKEKSKTNNSLQDALTFQGTRLLVRIQDVAIPALAVIGGVAVDTNVFALMSRGAGVQTWNEPGVRMAAWEQLRVLAAS